MDDPRKRLLAVRKANPSVRLSAAPKQTNAGSVTIVAAQKQPELQVRSGAPTNHVIAGVRGAAPSRPAPQFNLQRGLDALVRSPGEAVGKFTGALSDIAYGATEKIKDQALIGQKVGTTRATVASNADRFRQFADEDFKSGKITQQEHAARIAKVNNTTSQFKRDLAAAQVEHGDTYNPDEAALSVAATAAGGPGVISRVLGNLKGSVQGAFNVLRPSAKNANLSVAQSVAQETSPQVIKNTLRVDDSVANYLAQESNPEVIDSVIKSLQVDPNIKLPDNIRKRLEEEGVSRVERSDTDYGAEYQDGTIRFRSQEDVTESAAYHELGHHIFKTRLTPEERQLFKDIKGEAYTKSRGRKGYSEEDLISEDFSDFIQKALTGRIGEVPKSVRTVIAKYAKVAETESIPVTIPKGDRDAIIAAGGKPIGAGDLSKLAKNSFENDPTGVKPGGIERAAGEIDNGSAKPVRYRTTEEGDVVIEDGRHRIEAARQNGVDDFPTEDVTDLYKNAAAPAAKEGDLTEQAVAAGNAKALTGVGDVAEATTKATQPAPESASKGIKFRDPATRKQFERTYDDVEAEVTKLKELPEQTPDVKRRTKNLETKLAKYRSENAKFAFPDADADVQVEIQRVMDELAGASRLYNKAKKSESQELAQKAAAGREMYAQKGGGEAGFQAKLGSLKGERSKSTFQPIQADAATQTKILDDIEASNLRDYEKLNTQNAIRKIWGANPEKPTKSDITNLRKYFGDEFGDTVQKAVDDAGGDKTWRDHLVDIAGIPRAAMASFDMSMGLRQGGQVAVSHFKEWSNANVESAKYVANTKYFEKEMKAITNDDAFELMDSKLGIRLPAVYGDSDEIMASAHILERVPVYGRGIAASDRAYSGGLTKLRYNLAKQVINSHGGVDEFAKKFSDKEMKDIGEVINTSTGSGGKPGGFAERHMTTLATTLFAPRLWASRLNSLNPVYYARLSPVARTEALKNIGSFLALTGTIVGIAKAAGQTVEMDPRSSDFMKIKAGNTRYDIMGGLQQNIVFFARMLTGEKKNSASGEIQTLGDGYGKPNRFDLAVDMLGNKLNPLLGYAKRLTEKQADGTDKFGEEVNPVAEFANLFIPLGVQGLVDTIDDTGDIVKSIAMNIPSFVGIGVQTYGDTKTKETAEDGSFKGEITDDMVLNDDGTPILDDKGRPVKAKFEDGASDLEKKALKDDKKKAALTSQYKRELSRDDQALLKLDEEQLDKYLKDGDITQEQYDNVAEIRQKIKNLDGVKQEDGLTSQEARRFYEKFNSLSKKKQEEWLKGEASANSKKLAERLNKERVEGIAEFKPSQKLAKLYADYEQKLNTMENATELDRRNAAKKFQVAARKLNESPEVNDLFAEGGSVDTKTLIEEGKITREQLEAAIALDNELYTSGLTGSLKFSKKFRGVYGFGAPSSKGGSGSGGGGASGGSVKHENQHLSTLVRSNSTKASAVPKFSSRRRGAPSPIKFKAPAGAIPDGGGGAISIAPFETTSVSQLRKNL